LNPFDLDSLRSLDPSPLASLGRRAATTARRPERRRRGAETGRAQPRSGGAETTGVEPLISTRSARSMRLRSLRSVDEPWGQPLVDRSGAAAERRRVERSRAAAEPRPQASTFDLDSLRSLDPSPLASLGRRAATPLVDRRRGAPERRRVERSRAAAESRPEAVTLAPRPHPLRPVVATPWMMWRCATKKSTIIGSVVTTLAVTRISQCHSPPNPNASTSDFRPRGTVKVAESRR